MHYEIDAKAPLPPVRRTRSAQHVWGALTDILRVLAIGQSTLIPATQQTSVTKSAQRLGIVCTTKREGDNVRVWRIQ